VEGGGAPFLSLHNNVELVVRESPASKDAKTGGEKPKSLEAVTRQQMETRQADA
jgi:hypothetical protein